MGKGGHGWEFEGAIKPGDFVNAGSGGGVGLFTKEPVAKDRSLFEPLAESEKGLEDDRSTEPASNGGEVKVKSDMLFKPSSKEN